jgi:hypothetical protein
MVYEHFTSARLYINYIRIEFLDILFSKVLLLFVRDLIIEVLYD